MTQRPTDRTESTGDRAPAHRYNAALAGDIETRWQKAWDAQGAFRAPQPTEPGFDATRPKFYVLDMFPYPSGSGLHVGHPEGYTATDIIARYKRMRGFNVLHPMGWDAFGLPAEQYAVQTNVHPRKTTQAAIDTFRRQLKRFGFSYDWEREISTIDPAYYKWTQWIWRRLYHAWYDPRANNRRGAARPIETLLDDLAQERLHVSFTGELIEPIGAEALGVIAGTPGPLGARKWAELTHEERTAIVDDHRLAYQGVQTVNWCPKLGTVLANEEVIDGRSERGGHPVTRVALRQWMFRITAYAERLLDDLSMVDWPESTRTQQAEWIGRSDGAEVEFEVTGAEGETIEVFTTRPDTLFGATYLVLAPEHELVESLTTDAHREQVIRYIESISGKSDVERQESKDKSGVPIGAMAINPATGKPIPVWIADYVLVGYGTGAIMAVPAHDERDWEFARKFHLPVHPVVRPADPKIAARVEAGESCFAGAGVACHSANEHVSLDGLPTADAKQKMIDWLAKEGLGRRRVNYKLRDWLFSRQRYWGEPFPVMYDEAGHVHVLDEADLPVALPDLENFRPVESDQPQPPLGRATDWVNVEIDGKRYTRETNTMPNWAGSCWYYLRYCDPRNAGRFLGAEAERYWMNGGVDLYIGGAEHAVLHLLYARFWHKALFDLGEVSFPEPFRKLRHQGLIQSFAYQRKNGSLVPTDEVEDKGDGVFIETATGEKLTQIVAKMSKSLKNVVNPDDVIAEFGADTFRLYEMFMGPIEQAKPWNPRDIVGLHRFLQRVWRIAIDEETGALRAAPDDATNADVERALHASIKKVGEDIDNLSFNTAIASMMEFVNAATGPGVTRSQLGRFVRILSPFAPHIAEEIWSRLGHTSLACREPWPEFDPAMLVLSQIEIPVQVCGKVKGKILIAPDADEKAMEAAALADEKIQRAIEGKPVRKVIAVRGRMVNIVV